jgi:phage terminase large subunit-like protein
VAFRHSDRCLFPLRTWSKPEGAKGWQVPRTEVRDEVASAFATYRVARMYADPPFWQTDIDEWRAQHGEKVVHRWTSYSDTKIAEATARFDALTRAGELRHNGDRELRAHLAAARRQRCRTGWRPAKKDTRKIDVFLAALAAIHAHGDAMAAGELSDQRGEAFAIVL